MIQTTPKRLRDTENVDCICNAIARNRQNLRIPLRLDHPQKLHIQCYCVKQKPSQSDRTASCICDKSALSGWRVYRGGTGLGGSFGASSPRLRPAQRNYRDPQAGGSTGVGQVWWVAGAGCICDAIAPGVSLYMRHNCVVVTDSLKCAYANPRPD